MLGTLLRAGAVLDLFTEQEPEWGATATAAQLGIGKSLAHEELASLAAIGLLRRVEHGRYRLGWRTLTLATEMLRSSDLNATASPLVRELARTCDVAVAVMAWERDQAVCINSQRHQHLSIPQLPTVGRSWGFRDGAADLVLLAGRTADELERLWNDRALNTHYQTLAELTATLDVTRRRGWASGQLHDDGGRWVAAPVRDRHGDVAAALSLTRPSAQTSGRPGGGSEAGLESDARLACAAAARITRALRARNDAPYRAHTSSSQAVAGLRPAHAGVPGQACTA